MDYTVTAVLSARDKNFTSAMIGASKALEGLQNKANQLSQNTVKVGKAVADVGAKTTKAFTVPLTGAFAYAGKQFMEYEKGLVGVGKTTGMAGAELNGFGEEIKSLSNRIPVSTKDLLGLAETAGQLGIHGRKDLLEFTKVMAEMGSATTLAGEEGARAMAQFANIMGLDVEKNIRSVGNAIVRLGNNSATMEQDIMYMSQRLGASARLVGLTADEVLGLSAAMASLGINVEAGGSAMSQVLNKLDKAVAEGGEKLDMFAEVSGMTAQQFAEQWESDPIKAIEAFMKGLDDTAKSGGNMNMILDALGIKGIRESNTVKQLAQNHELLSKTLRDSADAYENGNDLAEEAAEAWGTLSSKLKTLKNVMENIMADVFSKVEPAITQMVETVTNFARSWENLSDVQKDAVSGMILKVGALLAATGPLLSITGKLAQGFGLVTGAVGKVSGGLSKLSGKFTGSSNVIKTGMDAVNNKFKESAEVFPKMGAKATEGINYLKRIPSRLQADVAGRVYDVFDKMEFDTQQKWTNALTTVSENSSKMGTAISRAFGKIGNVLNLFGINVGNMVKLANLGLKSLFPAAIIGTVLVGLGALYTGFEDEINKVLEVAKTKGPEIIQNLGNGIVEKIPEFASKGAELVSRLAETISANIPMILTVGANIVIALVESVGNNAGQLIGAAVQIIGSLLQGIIQNLPRLLVAGAQLIGQLVVGIVQNIPKILEVGGQAITGFISGLGQSIPQILIAGVKIVLELIKGLVLNIPKVIATGAKIILALGKAIIEAMGTIVGSVGSAIGGFFKKIFSPGKSEAAETNQEVTSETQSMSTNVTGIMEGLTSSVASSTSAMQDNVTSSYAGMAETMSTNFNQGVDAVTGASQSLSGKVPQDATNVSEQSATAYEQLAQRTQTAMDSMANSVESSMSKISTASTSGLQKLSTGFTNTFNQITNTVNQGTNQVINSVNNMNTRVTSAFSNFSSNFISTSRNMWTQFTNLSQQALNKNYSSFNSFTNKMSSRYKTFASQMRNSTNQMWRSVVNQTRQSGNNMAQAFASACQRTVSLANQLRNNLISIMNSTAGGMRSAGYNAGMGFYNGLASTRGSIMGLASSIANSVTARIRSALSIHSPSRVMMSMGSFAGEGLAVGLEKSKKFVNKAVDGLSDTVRSADVGFNQSYDGAINSNSSQPMIINLKLGNSEFRAFSRDITKEQGKDLRLEANFGL